MASQPGARARAVFHQATKPTIKYHPAEPPGEHTRPVNHRGQNLPVTRSTDSTKES